ncbi:diacylglycerol kinase family protein [Pallidibacillus pasinlerensis]|uniref:Diacylglycerol kinase family protein n=1 Tax=Pallidibacillus pasinlerensis TaxID=2703818 RepID=A0ABX0A4X2_9BACI|nr:diacylglycerol kinase family protein [Pallidibacillus pasinlerensis]NCU18477.1 diacylglycerol kinase family protein [Pallidibacillus pasinlerensis]
MKSFFLSFKYAFEGIVSAFKKERNLKIHFVIAAVVIVLGALFKLHKLEWIILILTIGIMIVLELINTSIERTIDLITEDYHPLAKQAKDIAAAACLVFAICTVIIGLIIFLPKII